MNILNQVYDTFWYEKFWLADNLTWHQVETRYRGVTYPRPKDLIPSIYISLILFVCQDFLKKYLLRPIGLYFGLSEVNNHQLIDFNSNSNNNNNNKSNINNNNNKANGRPEANGISSDSIKSYSSNFNQFIEQSWSLFLHTYLIFCGLWAVLSEDWIWSYSELRENYPFHSVSGKMQLYYCSEIGYYTFMLFQAFQLPIRRRDHWFMVAHHIITILGFSFSWITNVVRIASVFALYHDFCDPPLILGKVCKTMNKPIAIKVCLIILTITWTITRLILIPYIVYHFTFNWCYQMGVPFVRVVFIISFWILQIIQIFWTYFLFKTVYTTFVKGQDPSDFREDRKQD